MDSSAIDVLLTLFFTSFYLLKQFFPRIKSINSKLQESMKMVVVCVYMQQCLHFISSYVLLCKRQQFFVPIQNRQVGVCIEGIYTQFLAGLHELCTRCKIQQPIFCAYIFYIALYVLDYTYLEISNVFVLKHDCNIRQ